MKKRIHELKKGDIVSAHNALFRVLFDARESSGHRVIDAGPGPIDIAYTEAEWVSGEIVPHFFGPECNWVFQGNFNAGFLTIKEEG